MKDATVANTAISDAGNGLLVHQISIFSLWLQGKQAIKMTDTRCVNPEYQLDVDVMILEYLLYHAIRAQFDALRLKDENGQHVSIDADKADDRIPEAQRLLKTFDCEPFSIVEPQIPADRMPANHQRLQHSLKFSSITITTTLSTPVQLSVSRYWRPLSS